MLLGAVVLFASATGLAGVVAAIVPSLGILLGLRFLAGLGLGGIWPAAAVLVRLKTDYRYQFLLKASSRRALAEVLRKVRDFALRQNWPATALVIDVDPTNLM